MTPLAKPFEPGMFLYAKVVLGNLLEQGSEMDLEDELGQHFPHGLDEAWVSKLQLLFDKANV